MFAPVFGSRNVPGEDVDMLYSEEMQFRLRGCRGFSVPQRKYFGSAL